MTLLNQPPRAIRCPACETDQVELVLIDVQHLRGFIGVTINYKGVESGYDRRDADDSAERKILYGFRCKNLGHSFIVAWMANGTGVTETVELSQFDLPQRGLLGDDRSPDSCWK